MFGIDAARGERERVSSLNPLTNEFSANVNSRAGIGIATLSLAAPANAIG
jgi:hypothetical protein